MPLIKVGVVSRKVTNPERPKSKPKTIAQLAEDAKGRLAKRVTRRIKGVQS